MVVLEMGGTALGRFASGKCVGNALLGYLAGPWLQAERPCTGSVEGEGFLGCTEEGRRWGREERGAILQLSFLFLLCFLPQVFMGKILHTREGFIQDGTGLGRLDFWVGIIHFSVLRGSAQKGQ